MMSDKGPADEAELLQRCINIEGLTLAQLAAKLNLRIPEMPLQRKGWIGQAIEFALGATAGSKALPDFFNLGVELKTLPINHLGKPAESTFVTTISLLVKQRATLTPLEGKTASKIDPPESDNLPAR